jgi:hypothetical protein
MNKEISKNDLYDVVLVGKGPELQTLFKVIGDSDYNCGMFGLNWEAITLYDAYYGESFSILRYNRNVPKRSVNIDDFLHKEYSEDIKELTNINYEMAKSEAMFILRICFEFVKAGVLK